MVDVCLAIGPEVSGTAAWAMNQLAGGVFIVVLDALKAGHLSSPPVNMRNGLIFQAAFAWTGAEATHRTVITMFNCEPTTDYLEKHCAMLAWHTP